VARARWPIPNALLYHVLRRFPAWAGLLPAHTPRVVTLVAPEEAEPRPAPDARG